MIKVELGQAMAKAVSNVCTKACIKYWLEHSETSFFLDKTPKNWVLIFFKKQTAVTIYRNLNESSSNGYIHFGSM